MGFIAFAQQDAMYTHYMYNTLSVNPGYAGSRDALTVTGIHRSQWVGFDGAPTTQTLTVHSPLARKELGVGFSLVNDDIGPSHFTSMHVDMSYTIDLEDERKLSFGLKSGMSLLNVDLNSIPLEEQNDVAFENNIQSKVLPNFGFGIYYSSPQYYIGLSTPKIIQGDYIGLNTGTSGDNVHEERRHYFLIAGLVTDLSPSIKFKPTTFVKATVGAPLEADFTGSFIFQETIIAGAMIRTGDAVGALVGVIVSPQLELGYSFDWSYGLATGKYNGGSHEIVLRYDFIFKNKAKIRSPRYF